VTGRSAHERSCGQCSRRATYKITQYGCGTLPCACCGAAVDGAKRRTVTGPMLDPGGSPVYGSQCVCGDCSEHCRACRPFRDSGAIRPTTVRPEAHHTGRYDGGTPQGRPSGRVSARSRNKVRKPSQGSGAPIAVTSCECGCGRPVQGRRADARYATAVCRVRAQRRRVIT
jgi:hypothetical protein